MKNLIESIRATLNQELNEGTQYVIPEEIPANERTAFHGAAAAAAKAGKKSFNFGGKTHPVTMKKDTATAIADDVKEGIYKDMDTEKSEPKPRSDKKVASDFKKRRKTGEKSDVEMNPKLDTAKDKGAAMETKESTIRDKLMAVLSEKNDRAKHYKGATKPEGMHDKTSPGGKEMMNQPTEKDDTEEKGHKDAVKAAKTGPKAKARSGGDNTTSGDQKIIPSATPVKGQMYKTMEAYASMYEQSVTTTHDVTGDKDDKKGVINYVKKKAGGPVTVKHHGMTPNGDHEISVTGHPKHVMKFVNHHEGGKYSHDKEGHAQYKKDFD